MNKNDWTITVFQQDELYHAQCVSKQGETLTTELYETSGKALEAGHFIVERSFFVECWSFS